MGSAITQIEYESTSNTFTAGLTYHASEKVEIGIDGVWNDADAALEAFDFDVTPFGFMAYDFSLTHTNSDLDVSRMELGVHGRFAVGGQASLVAGYRYLDFEDDAPFLYDTSGSVSFYNLGVAWTF